MTRVRFVMVGGFLGAGKTTTLARLGRYYLDRGQRIGLVTNDQAQDLVDTNSLRAQGFAGRGSGRRLLLLPLRRPGRQGRAARRERTARRDPGRAGRQLHRPGRHGRAAAARTCTATASRSPPTRCCSSRATGCKILRDESGAGFSPKAAYIFRKQLEEADAIVINRIDELTPDQAGRS